MDLSILSRSLQTLAKMNGGAPAQSGHPPAVAEERSLGSYTHMTSRELYPPREKVVDEGCPEDVEPFPLLSGESVEYLDASLGGYHAVSNFRFFASQEAGAYNVPLGLIETAEVHGNKEELLVLCRDGRSFRCAFGSPQKCKLWQERLVQARKRRRKGIKSAFAFVHRAYYQDEKAEEGGQLTTIEYALRVPELSDWLTPEYRRMGMDLTSAWRISDCNAKYEICSTYPKLFVVPRCVSDAELSEAAKFRMSNRIPVIVWRHTNGSVIARSSQPLVGVLGWRDEEDERLLLAISQACLPPRPPPSPPPPCTDVPFSNGGPPAQIMGDRREGVANNCPTGLAPPMANGHTPLTPDQSATPPDLLVLDLRSYTAALGNRAKGGGCECQEYYPNCHIQYKGLPNIHSVRKSFQQLRNVVTMEEQTSFLSSLEATQWLSYLSQLLSAAGDVVSAIHSRCQPVLVHCSDGWDRTTQVVTLAELMLDSYYRTIQGFQVLVEREWLAYGHRFGDRCGQTAEDPNQCSPVFLQWLDCVHQLMRQFPCDFEFNEAFLIKLGQHCHSGLFGTFLGNCAREKEEERVLGETFSVWSLLHSGNGDFVNYLYRGQPSEGEYVSQIQVLSPVTHVRNMLLWRAMYCTSPLVPYHQNSCRHHSVDSRLGHGGTVDKRKETRGSDSSRDVSPERAVASPSPEISEGPVSFDPSSPSPEGVSRGSLGDAAAGYHTPTDSTSDSPRHSAPRLTDSPFSPAATGAGAVDADPLQDAMSSERCSVRGTAHLTDSNSTVCYGGCGQAGCLDVGADSLPRVFDLVHSRLRELDVRHRHTVSELQTKLQEARQTVRLLRERRRSEGVEEGAGPCSEQEGSLQEALDTPDEPPSSQNSWVCVDTNDSQGVMWVPDHAAQHCHKCGEAFSVVTRKHHCRSCGSVFCSTCANYYCPVPKEQLFEDVRVCERCFYKLDGHLKGRTVPAYPT